MTTAGSSHDVHDEGAGVRGEIDPSLRRRPVTLGRIDADGLVDADDLVVAEEPLEIRAAGPNQAPVSLVTTMRTPGHDDELAVGWLFAEGLIDPDDVVDIETGDPVALAQPDDQVTVRLSRDVDVSAAAHRHTMATASCGVCGRASIDELALRCTPVSADTLADPPVAWTLLADLPERLRRHQEVFGATGGLHATGVFDRAGELRTLREDVGRHNALDAAIGRHALDGQLPLDEQVVVLSGRVGFELCVKAAMAGVPMLVAVGAPTNLAVRTADRFGITLAGFVRNGRGNVYTHRQRVDPRA